MNLTRVQLPRVRIGFRACLRGVNLGISGVKWAETAKLPNIRWNIDVASVESGDSGLVTLPPHHFRVQDPTMGS